MDMNARGTRGDSGSCRYCFAKAIKKLLVLNFILRRIGTRGVTSTLKVGSGTFLRDFLHQEGRAPVDNDVDETY
jgi:hypothetical protein